MKCYSCFQDYENQNICPYCGYKGNMSVDVSHLVSGTILQNRYWVGKVLGAGGFGVTYVAWDQVLEHRVAIKEYFPGEFSTRSPGQTQITIYSGEKAEQFQAGKEKFLEESKRLAGFRNISGIVQIFDCFQENETVYIVMEYLDGETLESRLKRQNKLSEREAVEIISPVLQALESVHKEGILHRDIAPNNIFLCNTGEVKLLDFGAARSVTGSHSKSLTVLYKEGYTAEEQYRSRGEQGAWTDVYACAATLYRMITGAVPPSALERRVKDRLKAPSKCAHISVQTNKAILNALNVERSYRTQSTGVFLEELTGEKKVKKRFVRTVERRSDSIPVGVRVALGAAVLLSILFITVTINIDVPQLSQISVPEGQTRVPNLINCNIEEAQRKAEKSGLSFIIEEKQFSEEISENRILRQEIQSGSVVDEGTELQVIVSAGLNSMTVQELEQAGIELVEIPDLQYQDRDDAMEMLLDVGLDVEIEYETTGIVEGGRITKQSALVGEKLAKGQEIILTIEDFVVDFTDAPFIEEVIRAILNNPSGEIWASEMLEIEEIDVWYDDFLEYSEMPIEESIAPLKNCYNLKSLLLADGVTISTNGNLYFDSLHRYSDLESLANLVKLETLRLDNLLIEELNWLDYMKELQCLYMHGCEIGKISLESELENLTVIDLSLTYIENIPNEILFNNAWNLHLTGNTLLKISKPENMSNLSQIWIEYVGKEVVPSIEKIPNLYTLSLSNTTIDVEDLKDISNIRAVEIEGIDVTKEFETYENTKK